MRASARDFRLSLAHLELQTAAHLQCLIPEHLCSTGPPCPLISARNARVLPVFCRAILCSLFGHALAWEYGHHSLPCTAADSADARFARCRRWCEEHRVAAAPRLFPRATTFPLHACTVRPRPTPRQCATAYTAHLFSHARPSTMQLEPRSSVPKDVEIWTAGAFLEEDHVSVQAWLCRAHLPVPVVSDRGNQCRHFCREQSIVPAQCKVACLSLAIRRGSDAFFFQEM